MDLDRQNDKVNMITKQDELCVGYLDCCEGIS